MRLLQALKKVILSWCFAVLSLDLSVLHITTVSYQYFCGFADEAGGQLGQSGRLSTKYCSGEGAPTGRLRGMLC